MSRREVVGAATDVLLVMTMALVIFFEWTGNETVSLLVVATTTAAIALMTARVGWSRRPYVLIGAAFFLVTLFALPEWRERSLRSPNRPS